jgi:two-component system, NtrC family, response regulator AtoC
MAGGQRERPLVDSTMVSTSRTSGDGSRAAIPRRVVVGTGQAVTTHMVPDEGIISVGRSPDANIRIENPSVSRLHVRLHLGPVVRVEDLGSANGSRMSGERLRPNELTVLPPGHVVEIGTSWLMIGNAPLQGSTMLQDATNPGPEIEDEPDRIPGDGVDGLVVRDDAMRELHRLIERVAVGDISVLLYGETGVGKEVFARRIHALSPRADKPFLGLNCAALAATLLESELFGYERGAFTGAVQTKPGLLETAQGGTVLLDEIGEMPISIQVKLLRVLEERQVMRLGGTRPRTIDVRLLSATNRHLETAIEEGAFRRDLFFRLNSVTLEIPPLRERAAEIEPLARKFAEVAARRFGVTTVPDIEPRVWEHLRRYQWPGNIRQLRNVMERAVVMSEGGPITIDDLPADTYVGPAPRAPSVKPVMQRLGAPVAAPPPPLPVDAPATPAAGADDERQRILDALERCAGNQTRAAELLGVSRRTLVSRLSEYNLPRPRKRE